jgi:hypothetical protein
MDSSPDDALGGRALRTLLLIVVMLVLAVAAGLSFVLPTAAGH